MGLPAKSLAQGIKLQCCDCSDAHTLFAVNNNGGYETTSAQEYEFVKLPQLDKTYPGNRRAALLDAVLVAHAATRDDGGERLDMPLEAAALEQVAKKNKCTSEEMLDSVKFVLVSKAKEAFMGMPAVVRAIKALERQQGTAAACADSSDESNARILNGLKELAGLGGRKLKEARKVVASALREAQRIPKTGWGSFTAVAERVQAVVSREMLEALVLQARRNLAQANMTEEELTGLRLYTGAYSDQGRASMCCVCVLPAAD